MRPLFLCSTIVAAVWLFWPGKTVCAAGEDPMERLLDAIAQVESRSDPGAVGDGGRAIGTYQIHHSYWQDGTRILGVKWSYKDAVDPVRARAVVRAYLRHYGRGRTLLDMARIHNGGPKGHEKVSTRGYAQKIEAILAGTARSS